MFSLAIKNLGQGRFRLVGAIGGLAAALILLLVIEGAYAGSSEQLVAYIENSDNEVWVMQEGVFDMDMAMSLLPLSMVNDIESIEGVGTLTPILYASNVVGAGEKEWFSYIVSLPSGAARGGP